MSTEQFIAFVAARLAERLEQKLQQIAEGKAKVQKRLLSIREAAIYLGRTENAIQHLVHNQSPVSAHFQLRRFDCKNVSDLMLSKHSNSCCDRNPEHHGNCEIHTDYLKALARMRVRCRAQREPTTGSNRAQEIGSSVHFLHLSGKITK
jgi:hypothetical protein